MRLLSVARDEHIAHVQETGPSAHPEVTDWSAPHVRQDSLDLYFLVCSGRNSTTFHMVCSLDFGSF